MTLKVGMMKFPLKFELIKVTNEPNIQHIEKFAVSSRLWFKNVSAAHNQLASLNGNCIQDVLYRLEKYVETLLSRTNVFHKRWGEDSLREYTIYRPDDERWWVVDVHFQKTGMYRAFAPSTCVKSNTPEWLFRVLVQSLWSWWPIHARWVDWVG